MKIDMLNNGMDSLKRGFSSYLCYSEIKKIKKELTLQDYLVLKQAVLSTHHGVEILMKCILNKQSEFLIIDEIDANFKEAYKKKSENGLLSVFQTDKAAKIHTITYEEALSRVKYFSGLGLSDHLEGKLKRLNTVRNALTHAEVDFDDEYIESIFDKLLLDLDILFVRAIGSDYSSFYGYSELKGNYEKYMEFLSENQMIIKKKLLEALLSALEKTEQYVGQNEVIYIEDITTARKFLKKLQEELYLGVDLYNGYCSGKAKVKIKDDTHISIWADDNNGEYVARFKSMIICIPVVTSNESPTLILESDDDDVEPENKEFVSEKGYLEGIVIGETPEAILYDPKLITKFNYRLEYDETFAVPVYYDITRFLERRIIGCFNVQGLDYWNFHSLLRIAKGMTGKQLAEQLSQSLEKRKKSS